MSTNEYLLKWQHALKKNKLLKKEILDKEIRKYKLNNGEEISYGYGWHIKDIEGMLSREHRGHLFGYKSMAIYIPSKDIYAVTLSNCDCNSPTEITRKIAEIALKNFEN